MGRKLKRVSLDRSDSRNFKTEMNLNAALRWRYATKKFDPLRIVDEALVNSILESANLTASSYGLQPYQLVVVQDRNVREELVSSSFGQRQVLDASHLIVIAMRTDVDEVYIRQFIDLKERIRKLDCGSLAGYGEMMSSWIMAMTPAERFQWAARQTYLVMGTLLTACALAEIDACPLEGFIPDEFDQKLNLTNYHLHAQLLLAIGYRSAEDETQFLAKVRRPIDEMVIRL
jgi:nitroreductase / dihydropteridine reductase